MKKTAYISSFILLGFLVQLLLHAGLEMAVINCLLVDNPNALGISFAGWKLIHHLGTVVLLLAGLLLGYQQGRYWWRRVYKK